MAQPFSMRYLLVDGQGNFGSVDGDTAAAMRYTEVAHVAHRARSCWRTSTRNGRFHAQLRRVRARALVLPTRVPNLLVNGQTGIAVGMADQHPAAQSHETVNACLALLDDPALPLAALMQHIAGAGLSHRRHHQRRAGNRHRLSHRPRPTVGARAREHRGRRQGANRQAIVSPSFPTRSTRRGSSSASPSWCARS